MGQPLYLIKWEHIPLSHQNDHAVISDHMRTHLIVIAEWPSVLDRVFQVTDQAPMIPRMAIALISDQVGSNHTVISEWLNTHIWHGRNQSSHHDRMAQPLYLTCSSEWIWNSSLSLGGNFDLENPKLLPEVLKLHSSQWLCQ